MPTVSDNVGASTAMLSAAYKVGIKISDNYIRKK
jgi:hypothetical protein